MLRASVQLFLRAAFYFVTVWTLTAPAAAAGYSLQSGLGQFYRQNTYDDWKIALSADGSMAVVSRGEIYVRVGSGWESRGALPQVGTSVAISSDGSTILVGGAFDSFVLVRSGNSWTQQGSALLGSIGGSIALSGDGNTAAIGDGTDSSNTGAVTIWKRSGGVWAKDGSKLVGTGAIGSAAQGTSVALSYDGTTLASGGPSDNSSKGAIWIFVRGAGGWAQQGAKLTGDPYVGYNVALSSDGNTLLSGNLAFLRSGTTWGVPVAMPSGVGGSESALSADGETAVFCSSGTVIVFGSPHGVSTFTAAKRNGTSWTQYGSSIQVAFSPTSIGLICKTAVSGDGRTALVSANNTTPGNVSTSAYVQDVGKAPHDFNADSESDIVWRNSTGDNAMWLMNGATIASVAGLPNVPTNWYVVGQRDFNGDGKTDLLWASTTGDVAIWLMNGSTITSVASLGNVGANWGVAGTADFNGDGKGDILWRSTAGDNAIWFMNGTSLSSIAVVGNVPTNWTVVGTADFNADSKGDILWRNSAGDNAIWLMNGATISSVAGLGNVPTNWSIVGTADFNGDGKGDIMWRNSGGDNAIWLMNGTTISSVAGLGNIPTNWSVLSNGDYNGDGNGDILWRNSAGDNAIWFMNGTTLSSISGLGNVPTNWTIQNAAAN